MQITIKSVRTIKTGTSDKGDWEWLSVSSQKGTEYTTFDKKVKHLGEGSIIEIGEPDEKKGKLSFSKVVEIIKEVPIGAIPEPPDKTYKRDTEGIEFEYKLKARLQEIERASIEAQSAFKGIIDLAVAQVISLDNFNLIRALEWAKTRLGDTPTKPTIAPQSIKSTRSPVKEETNVVAPKELEPAPQKPKRDPSTLKTIGDLRNALLKDFGIRAEQQLKEFNISNWTELAITPAEAYIQMKATR